VDRLALLIDEHLDHGLRVGVRTDANSIDIVVGQIDCFVAEQLATPLERDLVDCFAGWKDLVSSQRAPQTEISYCGCSRVGTSRDLPRRPSQLRG